MLSFILLVIGVLAQLTFAEEPEAIIRGQDVERGEFPYQVSLIRNNGSHICGGSIINQTKILTAAHCVDNIERPYRNNLKIVAGNIDIDEGSRRKVKSIRVHPRYSANFSWVDDVAVITLAKPIQYNRYRAPINLTDVEPAVGQQCTLAGWGQTETNGSLAFSRILQKINQTVTSLEDCRIFFPNSLTENHTCADNGNDGNGICTGDTGGPLVCNGTQIGILAGGIGNCVIGAIPNVYMNVYHYREFILSS